MRGVRGAPLKRGGRYTAHAIKVLPSAGIFPDLFLTAVISSRPKHLYEFGPFVLDPADRALLRDGSLVPLQPKVFDTLLVLVKYGGHLVEKNEFMRAVWPEDEFVEEQNLNKNISKLRRALGEGVGGAKYIETVPKSGYRFAAEVRVVVGTGVGELSAETRTRASLVIEDETHERWQLAEPKMVNPKAYELFLKGRFYWEKGTTGEQKKAIEITVVTSDNHH